jgi:hypothetical protein
MKTQMLKLVVLCMFAGWAIVLAPPAADAQGGADQGPQLLIKIRNIDRLLNDIERLMPAGPDANAAQQVAMFRGMLQGTDWIDPERSIVAGMLTRGSETNWVALIPYRAANANFHAAYSAIDGGDYYMTAFPPQPNFVVRPAFKDHLLNASVDDATRGLLVEAAASQLLAIARPKIEAAFEKKAAVQPPPSGQAAVSDQQAQAMFDDMLKTFEQVEIVRLGLDLSDNVFALQFDIDALPDTFLAGLLIDRGEDTRLTDYAADTPMKFRTRAYNVPGLMQLVGSGFGQVYRQMGIDFDELAEMTKSFTGEMVGGMQAAPNGLAYEMIYVFQPGVDGEDFIINTYLPWFERYNQQMAAFVAQQTGTPQMPLYERTADSLVAGVNVVGVKTNYHAMLPPGEQGRGIWAGRDQVFETRLASVGDLMFFASDDAAMENLITRAGGFENTPARGPMAWFEMDLESFVEDLRSMMPSGASSSAWPANLGRLTMQADMQEGRLTTRTRFNIDDLSKLGGAFSALAAQSLGASGGAGADAPTPSSSGSTATDMRDPEARPDYWYDRGGLQSAYGAYAAAARSYQKAIALAPRYADAHFQLGVTYGELRQFEAAIKAMTRAIDLDADKGAYYYGRGRVYLLAGEEAQAMRDFMEAGFLGNPDARAYLSAAGVSLE